MRQSSRHINNWVVKPNERTSTSEFNSYKASDSRNYNTHKSEADEKGLVDQELATLPSISNSNDMHSSRHLKFVSHPTMKINDENGDQKSMRSMR